MCRYAKRFNRAMAHAACAAALWPAAAGAQACDTVKPWRAAAVGGAFAVGEVVVVAARHGSWWSTPTTGFHVRWDASASAEQDRLLHAAVGYHVSQLAAVAFDWSCVAPETAGWLGAALAVAAGLPKELGDGLHEAQGFSVPDMAWTTAGAILPALHRQWPATRVVSLEVWYWPSPEFRNRAGALPSLENDYAGQRYYVAIHPGRVPGGGGAWPDWLGVAVGHGTPHWISAPPTHEGYFTLDLSLRGLPIRSGLWRAVATVLDQVHWPMPGVKLDGEGARLGFF